MSLETSERRFTLVKAVVLAVAFAVLPIAYPSFAEAGPGQMTFVSDGVLPLAFSPDPSRTTIAASLEGCATEPGMPKGILGPPTVPDRCHSAPWGWALKNTQDRAEFISAPFGEAFWVGGPVKVVLHNVDPAEDLLGSSGGALDYQLTEVSIDGTVSLIGSGLADQPLSDGRYEGTFDIKPAFVRAGSRLRIRFAWFLGYTSSGSRMLFGGPRYGDSGITFAIGHFE